MGKTGTNYQIQSACDNLSLIEEPQMVLFEEAEILNEKSRLNGSKKINGDKGSLKRFSENDQSVIDLKALLNVENKLLSIYKNKMKDKFILSRAVTFQLAKKMPVHSWFQYTQGFSPQIVDYYLDQWGSKKNDVFLDPFVGSGTSLLQCN